MIEYTVLEGQAKANASGIIVVTFPTVPAGFRFDIERVTIVCDSSTDTECTLYRGRVADVKAVDTTGAGNFDTADQAQPIRLFEGESLIIRWTGASVGAVGSVNAQVAIVDLTEQRSFQPISQRRALPVQSGIGR